jgi:FixJ family two-component response regulator
MGGEDLILAIRALHSTVCIVVLTGHSTREKGESLKAAGADAWLDKPPSLESLARVVSQTLQNSRPAGRRHLVYRQN